MRIALAGNPNSGKTTLFNELTKTNQRVGNWPGVTVERKEGKCATDKSIEIIDLPGVYLLEPCSEDEKVTASYLFGSDAARTDVIINVIDSTNLERSLALSLQLLALGIPVVLALNMTDELASRGMTIDANVIAKEFDVPVVEISARRRINLDKLVAAAKDLGRHKRISSFVSPADRHAFIKLRMHRFRTVGIDNTSKVSDGIDRIVLNKWLAFPIFAVAVWTMYYVSIQTVGALCGESMQRLIFNTVGDNARLGLVYLGAPKWVSSLLIDGVVTGVGAVLSFIPQLIILFVFISFFESCGYMARVAVLMDRIFKKIGLSGKSFIPMIVGCGCTVPAIMSAKTIESERERKSTIMLAPFVPCSAKLPVFALIAGALFPGNAFVAPSMYFLSITMVILGALLLKSLKREGQDYDTTFVMEIPPYRAPNLQNMMLDIWDKVKGFISRAGAIIVPAAIVLWFLQSFNFKLEITDIEHSMLAVIGKAFSWIFVPLGFGKWQCTVAVFTGIFAKETVVSTFGILLGESALSASLAMLFTPQSAYAFMVFILLSSPCIAAIGAIRKEMGSVRLMWRTVGFQCAVAYITALVINQSLMLWSGAPLFCAVALTVLGAAALGVCFAKWLAGSKKSKSKLAG